MVNSFTHLCTGVCYVCVLTILTREDSFNLQTDAPLLVLDAVLNFISARTEPPVSIYKKQLHVACSSMKLKALTAVLESFYHCTYSLYEQPLEGVMGHWALESPLSFLILNNLAPTTILHLF